MTIGNISRYILPQRWVRYDAAAILDPLVEAKTAAGILRQMPHLPQWIEQVYEEQLRLEAVGTSRIEGAEFTQDEQDVALAIPVAIGPTTDSPWSEIVSTESALTRSQRQLRAADATYRWLRSLPADRPVDAEFILDIHRRIVTGCDDDRCEPGTLRSPVWNGTFGMPLCRGVEGGDDCRAAFNALCHSVTGEFQQHDSIIQALAVHYHIGAMHPFGDGNGRTSRAAEAFMLRRAGVNELVMVSLSNYYYAHQDEYRAALTECRRRSHDLTPFLQFALPAVTERCNSVADQIVVNHKRTLFGQLARSLFGKLRSPRRRVLAERQLLILDALLETDSLSVFALMERTAVHYQNLRYPQRGQVRDILNLSDLGAIDIGDNSIGIRANLDWPQQFAESELLERLERMPPAVSDNHPATGALSTLLGRRR